MGADFTIEQDGKQCPVLDVTGDAFVIQDQGKEQRIPMSRGAAKIKITPALKMTESSAELNDVKTDRAYTAANDPDVAFQRSLVRSALLNSDAIKAIDQANAGVHTGDVGTAAGNAAAQKLGYVPVHAASDAENARAIARVSTARIMGGPGTTLHENQSLSRSEGSFDAMDVKFKVSAPRALVRPFVVFVAQYRPPGAKPGQIANWIYARALKPVGRTPTEVQVEQGGFPPGFELQEFQIHLYDQGEEIVTNLSPKRVDLTTGEARQYVLAEYIGSHKGATLPAAPAMGHLPEDFPQRLAKGDLREVVYVKVAADGRPLESFRDRACSQKFDDPYVNDVVARLFFKPALAEGRPVESVTALDLSKLVM